MFTGLVFVLGHSHAQAAVITNEWPSVAREQLALDAGQCGGDGRKQCHSDTIKLEVFG